MNHSSINRKTLLDQRDKPVWEMNHFYAHHLKSFHTASHICGFMPTHLQAHECVGTHGRAHTGQADPLQHVVWCVAHVECGQKSRKSSSNRELGSQLFIPLAGLGLK
ncbi:hypothetical protein CHARACLAT_028189 [Characodon lateralis]|uniref:Uncharacterized protein n=1 Tax=Characodon lateralis TaxID=208331 RepID=A0ABU7F8S5_9TELE|nr:hypothetical protein [Characodon lateralis]